MPESLAHRRELRFWGWGYVDEELAPAEETRLTELVALTTGGSAAVTAPRLEEFSLPAPRGRPPVALASICSATPYDRLTHAYGKSFADGVRMLQRAVPRPPDWVAFPRDEAQLEGLLAWADSAAAAVIPFGGGTSVCGGVETAVQGDYGLVLSIDLQYLNRVLELDRSSRAALIEGGALGPELEAALKPHQLTLRHFPQSFQFSTLGGWIATRAGGHYATQYTHIDDFVESIRMLTPSGLLESRRLPGSGAGPSPDRMLLGSEGTLGLITRAWMRVQDRPRFRASASVRFADMTSACSAVRAISQAALFPSNCRLLDPVEALINGVGDGTSAVLVLAFESADHPLDAWLTRALELMADHGGEWDREAAQRSLRSAGAEEGEHRQGEAGAWRNQFLRAPYYRNYLTPRGVIADTFETAITWDRFEALYQGVQEAVGRAIREATGAEGMLSCRFTHVYPDGPAPYFTFYARGTGSGDMAAMLGRWRQIKLAANEAVTALGGTVTHHHAVGRDHRPQGYDRQVPPLFQAAFAGARAVLDPRGMMNPGVLVDTPGRGAVGGGVLGA
ncbi:FAD-binding oxidoreductase [Haliea sp. E1-2-M8]|uniref:FAD-binding oxidoreductase n=1 Tax=Haliea sp. E1-2-M8 TaxID=3064706 RepID=UPI0027236BAE|nr:FAD-binding oxidoreductase [Haliea sp. E1-2-M8]MDO8863300.1 FAD-binding oxidoreductase [Haliea sp. E1-2-M8]